MHQQVLGGRLWYTECQDANQDLPEQLPLNYDSAQQYVSTFEPLLFEEAREAVRSTWVESCDMKKTFTVDVTRYVLTPNVVYNTFRSSLKSSSVTDIPHTHTESPAPHYQTDGKSDGHRKCESKFMSGAKYRHELLLLSLLLLCQHCCCLCPPLLGIAQPFI